MSDRRERSFLERALSLVTVVHPEEVATALVMTLNGFLLLAAYSCVKPVREALILAQPGGAEYKVYMGAATAVVLIFAVPLYARVSRNIPRNSLIVAVTLFFASNLIIFYGLAKTLGQSLPLALGFYLWIAIFNMMIVAQFWAFANDLYVEETGKRLFPLFGLGVSLGAVAGAGAATAVLAHVDPREMMLIAAVPLMGTAALTQWVHRREVRRARSEAARETATGAIGGSAGDAFRMVFANRYLLLIALFSLVFTLVKTNGDYLLSRIVQGAAQAAVSAGDLETQHVGRYIGSFFAGFQFKIDLLGLFIQAIVVSRLVKYLGVGASFFILPMIALGDAVLMVAFPVLAAVRIGKTAESAFDYSLNNTLRGMLWLPTSRRAKYLAKQAVDTFFVRMGDVTSALLVFAGIHVFNLPLRGFAAANVALVGVWLLLARGIVQQRARIPREPEGEDHGGDGMAG